MRSRLTSIATALLVIIILTMFLLPSMIYFVDQRESAVVLQFGDPIKERTEPGMYFKKPFIQRVVKLPATIQFWGGDPVPDLPTKDDKKIEIVPWAIWRINEPTAFVQRLRTIENAERRVSQLTRSAMRDVITQYDLPELVRSKSKEPLGDGNTESSSTSENDANRRIDYGRQVLIDQINKLCTERLAVAAEEGEESVGRGIELVDLGISQIEFVASVRESTFDRWIAERQAVSARNTNEGERLKKQIVNQAKADVERIVGEGQQKANEIQGEVDAEIIKEYAEAITEMGEFYTFVRTLEAYEKAIASDTRMILTTDSEFLNLIKRNVKATSDGRPD